MSAASPEYDRSLSLLQAAFGADARFRTGQWEAIEKLLQPGARLLVIERTGWGKSIVYFISTALRRESGHGPTIIVSPLLALMRNQVEMAERLGLRARTMDSTNQEEWEDIAFEIAADSLDVLMISPERLDNSTFKETLLPTLQKRAGLLVIDEAHCISDWGHDFRPDYQRILQFVEGLNPSCAILATTATATDRVAEDVRHQLGGDVQVQRGPLMRESLQLSVFELGTHAERLAWLAKYVPKFAGSGIIYTLTVYDAEQVAEYLHREGIVSDAYHADLEHEARVELEARFRRNELKALVATTALGMGYDKADVGFVVHYQLPMSILAYYQQIGRAGRMLGRAYGALLWGPDDESTAQYFIESAMPPKEVFDKLQTILEDGEQEFAALKSAGSWNFVGQALSVLEVEGVVVRSRGRFRLVEPRHTFDYSKVSELRAARWADYEALRSYARSHECRMQMLARALGDPMAGPCGKCDNCKPLPPIKLDERAVERADAFLRSATFPIEPRKRLLSSDELERSIVIAEDERLEPGIALSSYNDSGWGRLVRSGKYGDEFYSDALLEPSIEAIASTGFQPDWIAWIPSFNNDKVEDFAKRLADKLEIPAVKAVRKVRENQPQKAMRYGKAQMLNVWSAFRVENARPGRCLLVDDIVDSGWTMTAVGILLRHAGATQVMPFALATARPRRKR
jgi:ATP-dependent DNA helicase RecQ